MKLFNTKKLQVVGLLTVAVLGVSTMLFGPQAAAEVSFGGPFNCDDNAVLYCGAKSASDIVTDYNKGTSHNSATSIRDIYSWFTISSSDVQNIGTTAVAGSVTKSGDVYVGNTLVATDAMTSGRQNIKGSETVKSGSTKFYVRKTSVSFQQNTLSAYVVMQDGQFKFAILSACGNPIKATPKPPTKGSLACTALLTTPGIVETNGDQAYTFEAEATSTNANISKYVFDLGKGHGSQIINSSNKTATTKSVVYAPGTYTVSVTISGEAKNSFTSTPGSVTCSKQFTVPTAQTGTLTCSSLTPNSISTNSTNGDVTYTLTAQASAKNATITSYMFDFGNGTTQKVTTNDSQATSQQVVYSAGQTYNPIFVTVYGTSNSDKKALTAGGVNTICATNLTIPPQTCATGSTASSCQPTCTSPSGQSYPAGSQQCTPVTPASPTTPATPTTTTAATQLANTGPGNTIGLFLGTAIVAGIGYRFMLRRRLNSSL